MGEERNERRMEILEEEPKVSINEGTLFCLWLDVDKY